MATARITKKNKSAIGRIQLSGSKSISNRVLIIQALCEDTMQEQHLDF